MGKWFSVGNYDGSNIPINSPYHDAVPAGNIKPLTHWIEKLNAAGTASYSTSPMQTGYGLAGGAVKHFVHNTTNDPTKQEW